MGLCRRLRIPGTTPLHERDGPRDEGEGEQDDCAGQQRAQTAVGVSLTFGLALACLTARGQKLALELVQLWVVGRGPVAGRGQTRAAEERPGSRPSASHS